MAKNNSVNLDVTNEADGVSIIGGVVKRTLKWLGSNITLTGSGTNIYTFPNGSQTLVGDTGWISKSQTFTYFNYDANYKEMDMDTTSSVASDDFEAGMRIRYTLATNGEQFGIITKVSEPSAGTTRLTIYHGTDYAGANQAISSVQVSRAKKPEGFDIDPAKWTQTYTNSTAYENSSITVGTWYDTGDGIRVPTGSWTIYTGLYVRGRVSSGTFAEVQATLSDTTNSNNIPRFLQATELNGASGDNRVGMQNLPTENYVRTTPVHLNLLIRCQFVQMTDLRLRNDIQPVRIKAVCAYI